MINIHGIEEIRQGIAYESVIYICYIHRNATQLYEV